MEKLNGSRQRMRHEVGSRLRQRSSKYVLWLTTMRFAGFFMRDFDKGSLLEADYLWLREVDDIADGDKPLPAGYSSQAEYVAEKLTFLRELNEPQDDVDALILFCSALSSKIGIDLSHPRQMIMESMLFDAQRLGTGAVFPEAVLQEYFYKCDIVGTIAGALPLFGESTGKWPYLYDSGQAVRIYYNLRDFEDDIDAGLVNISEEDMQRFGITNSDLYNIENAPLKAWFTDQAEQGLALLEKGTKTMKEAGLKPMGRHLVNFYHGRPARKFFKTVLQSKV